MHLNSWLRQHQERRKLVAIGHRVVHGGEAFSGPVLVDEAVIQGLEALVPLAPLHQPLMWYQSGSSAGACQGAAGGLLRHRLPSDAARHRSLFALPREMRERGVRRYGFHGLSYDSSHPC